MKSKRATAEWPLVEPNDDGIRPAGPPNECFYCGSKVGQPHHRECVCIIKRVEMRVTATLPSGEVLTGLWRFNEVHSWSPESIEFHKNKSSWCASNFLDHRDESDQEIVWDFGMVDPWGKLEVVDRNGCLCGTMRFDFVRVVDPTPQRRVDPMPLEEKGKLN